ncbi:MAG: hypothetical protein WDZ35_02180 [Crocinitomicaceae bacterium]
MSIAEIFESGERKQDKGHFRNMVILAHSDGELSSLEDFLLTEIGKKLDLSASQIEEIKKNPRKFPVNPPSNRIERFEQIVRLIQMIQVDGKVTDKEMKVLEKVAVSIGFSDLDEVDVESILALIVRGEDVDVIIDELL